MSVPRVILASLEINAAETSSTQNFNAQTLRNNKKINRAHTKKKSFAKRNATAINGPPKEEEDEKEEENEQRKKEWGTCVGTCTLGGVPCG